MSTWGLIHTNDFHDKLTTAATEKLRDLVSGVSVPKLVLDAGDCVRAGNLGTTFGQEAIWDRMASVGYDAVTMGNRETHPLLSVVRGKLRGCPCPVLCANQVAKKVGADLPFISSLITKRAGLTIGIIGVTIPMVTQRSKLVVAWDTYFRPPVDVALELASEYRSKVDVLIALTHIGIADDRRLAEQTALFDVIVSGHSHRVHEQPEIVNGIPILQAGSFGRFAGVAMFDRAVLLNYKLEALVTSP